MTGSASSVLKTDTRLLSENLFLNYGLESLFKDVAIIAGNVNYIIFDIDDYYTVQKGMDIRQISCELNVHLKTIYSVRYHVLTKLGCRTVLDYQILSVSKAFTHWLTINNVDNVISRVNSKVIA